ncbi:hypothetical protein, partial [Vibrio parahaemolyticus]|uniref:hypothetical protein n=1 Tax=Vibrio parahaemolyticus TaxID=670 RepID=UPI001E56ABAD
MPSIRRSKIVAGIEIYIHSNQLMRKKKKCRYTIKQQCSQVIREITLPEYQSIAAKLQSARLP